MTDRGKFITVEGTEGVGKSTNIAFLKAKIESRGHSVVTSREPGGTPMAERIRNMLLEHGDEPLPDDAELLLFFAARALHINNTILPALNAGQWVVCDRFTDASRAYQGYGRGLPLEWIDSLADRVQGDLRPDFTILLDAPAALGLARAEQRGAADRLESEQVSFYQRVRDGYLAIARSDPERFAVVDAGQRLTLVQTQIEQAIGAILDDNSD